MDRICVYMTSPNQKIVQTYKAVSDSEHPYSICNLDAMLMAARNLTDRAFKLYVRMNLHQDDYTYALSPVEINDSIGMSDKRYREAVKELAQKGYLVKSKKRQNLYLFLENPDDITTV